MLQLLAIGIANLARPDLFMPRRREHLPEIHFAAPLPTVRIGNLDTALKALRNQAWLAYDQVAAGATAVKAGQRKTLG